MTTDEKRKRIRDHCKVQKGGMCDGCPAIVIPNGCYEEGIVSDRTVNRVYKLLVEKGELKP